MIDGRNFVLREEVLCDIFVFEIFVRYGIKSFMCNFCVFDLFEVLFDSF